MGTDLLIASSSHKKRRSSSAKTAVLFWGFFLNYKFTQTIYLAFCLGEIYKNVSIHIHREEDTHLNVMLHVTFIPNSRQQRKIKISPASYSTIIITRI